MRKWLTYIGLLLFITCIIFLYGFAQYKHNAHRINEVKVYFIGKETQFLTYEMVNKLLIQNVGNPLNQLNSSINLHLVENSVRSHDMVDRADVFLKPEGHLNIFIRQKVPILRIKTAVKSYYIDNKGRALPLSPIYSKRVPLVTGVYTKEMEQEVFQLVSHFRNDDFFQKQIIGINRLPNGDYILENRVGDHKIIFGNAEDIDDKMRRLNIFYKKMWNDEKLKEYAFISVKYKKQVIGIN